jgi:hypothetical protein
VTDTKVYSGLTAVMRSLPPAKPQACQPARRGKVVLASLTDVEELLDYLESAGYYEMSVAVVGEQFVVRWR